MGKRYKNRKKNKRKSFVSVFFKYILYSMFCGMAAITCVLLYFSKDLPDLQNLKTEIRNPAVTVQTYDGKIIGAYGDLYEDVMAVEDLPKHVPAAFMAVEDKRFFQHFGIDFIGFFRAVYQNYVSGRVVQGGSTITQQLAKNILIGEGVVTHYDKSIGRKIRELLLAIWLEHKFTKSDIMMMYLNRVYFGAATFGIDAASRKYFNKPAKNLTVYESAVLAGLLKAPSKYSPSNSQNFASERAYIVLKAMEEQGFIKSADEIRKKQEKEAFANDTKAQSAYMYFCDFAYEQAKKILGEIEDDIVIVTTLEESKQKAAEESVKFFLKTEGENYKFSQSSFICLGRDGAVKAMVGGAGYSMTQFNRVTQSVRMPGSAFKIFVYGAAIEYGYQLEDMISDAPIEIAGWKPGNYHHKTRGSMSLLDGFAKSINSISIRLAQAIGLKRVSEFSRRLGIDDVSTDDFSVALGTTPVTLKDLTASYTSFMDGMPIFPFGILEVRTKSGEILYQHQNENDAPVLDDETLADCRKLLHGVVQFGTGHAAKVNDFVYGKTGTNGSAKPGSNENSDAWFLGFYDPKDKKEDGFSFGVWVGNDNNGLQMIPKSTGGRIPAKIASRFMKKVLVPKDEESDELDENADEEEVEKKEKTRKSLDSILDSAQN